MSLEKYENMKNRADVNPEAGVCSLNIYLTFIEPVFKACFKSAASTGGLWALCLVSILRMFDVNLSDPAAW